MSSLSSPTKTTVKEVAQYAGVSTATVSRVLSGSCVVSDELRQRVQGAIEKLDYHPNQLGRNLRKQVTNIIGLIVSDIQNPFFTSLMRGIQDTLRDKSYVLLSANSDENPEQEMIHLETFRSEGVAGVIFTPSRLNYAHDIKSLQRSMLLVAVDRRPANLEVDTVMADNAGGTLAATMHLIELGHRRIGYISGPKRISTSEERSLGYQSAMRAAGLEIHPGLFQIGNFRQQGGYEAMKRMLDLPEPPTAVLSANNLMTLGALQAIHDRCLVIPDDIAIIGFDDMSWAASLQPPLTVVAQSPYEMGQTSARLLLERLTDSTLPLRHVVLQTRLIVRASTGSGNCR
jgi:LacI family transcriptional regulator